MAVRRKKKRSGRKSASPAPAPKAKTAEAEPGSASDDAPVGEPAQRKRYWWLLWFLLPVGAITGIVIAISSGIAGLDRMVKAPKAFAGDLKAGRVDAAYRRMTPTFRRHVPLARFREMVAGSRDLKHARKLIARSSSYGSGKGKIVGSWVSAERKAPVVVRTREVKGTWYVHAVLIEGGISLEVPEVVPDGHGVD